jgi:peroxiredoxin
VELTGSGNIAFEARHPVSDEVTKETEKIEGEMAPDFKLPTATGDEFHLNSALKKGPAVLIATMEDCPCTHESQGFFNQLALNYRDAQFVGVIDSEAPEARNFKSDFAVPYPMALELEGKFFREYESPSSVYVTVVNQRGEIVRRWAGYSTDMLFELNNLLAELTGSEVMPFDSSRSPDVLTTGCNFYVPAG